MANPVVHFEIMGSDSRRTQGFYSDLFGWSINSDNPMGYGLALTQGEDGLGINGGIGGADQGGVARVSVYAQVDDAQAYLDRAVALGGSVALEPTAIPETSMVVALFTDPDGHYIGLVQEA